MRTILLIDDEHERWTGAMAGPAEMEGWALQGVGSVEEAETRLGALAPDVILLDLRFPEPGIQGQDALPRLRAMLPDTPVIVLTASDAASDIRTAVECLKDGAWDYFTKSDLDIRRLFSEAEKAAQQAADRRRRRRLLGSFVRVAARAPHMRDDRFEGGCLTSFAFSLSGITVRPQVPHRPHDTREWQAGQLVWQSQLLSGLHSDAADREVELRYLSRPGEAEGTAIGFIGRGMGATPGEARDAAESLWVDLHSLLKTNSEVYSFEAIGSEDELFQLLEPFEPRFFHEIRRTGLSIALRGAGGGIGFAGAPKEADPWLVLPWVLEARDTTLLALCRVLSDCRHPLCIAITARPQRVFDSARLPALRREFEDAGSRMAVLNGTEGATPTPEQTAWLEQRARGLGEEGGFVLRLGVASPQRIPRAILNVVANEFLDGKAHHWDVAPGSGQSPAPACPPCGLPFEELAEAQALLAAFPVEEAARVFRLPLPGEAPVPGIPAIRPAFAFLPECLPQAGCLLGCKTTAGGQRDIRIAQDDLSKHVYVLGQTGTGKSTVLSTMILSQIREGGGVCVVDPHGDLIGSLLPHMPAERLDDILLFDPSDREYPVALNLLEWEDEDDIDFLSDEIISIFIKLFDPQNSNQTVGPQFQQAMRAAARGAMYLRGTVLDMPRFLEEPDYLNQALPLIPDEATRAFFENVWRKKSDFHRSEALGYFTSKLEVFRQRRAIARIVGQARSTVDLSQVMDEGKVLLVNLSRGALGPMASGFLGMVLCTRLFMAVMRRQHQRPESRRPFSLYIDEFQTFTTETVQQMVAEVRKFGLTLVLAHQNLSQLKTEAQEAILGNVGSLLCFRCGVHDAATMEKYLDPQFSARDLLTLPNWHVAARPMVDGHPAPAFVFETAPETGIGDPRIADHIRTAARKSVARPVAEVDAEVRARLTGPPTVTKRDALSETQSEMEQLLNSVLREEDD